MAQTKKQPSAKERERREAQKQAATAKAIFTKTPEVTLPGIGTHRVVFTNGDLADVEFELTPLLDTLPDHLSGQWQDAKGNPVAEGHPRAVWHTYANVWEAMEVLSQRFVLRTMNVLLTAGLRHAGVPAEKVRALPPSILGDEDLQERVGSALAVAFGEGVEEEGPSDEAGASPAE